MTGGTKQIDRDQATTGFSKHLDQLVHQLPEALCAGFVDGEGETVDFASRVDPFDAKITGAEMAIVLSAVRMRRTQATRGAVLELRIEGIKRSAIARMVSEGYDLVMLVSGPSITSRAAELTAATALALLLESGLKPPPSYAVLRAVEQRASRVGYLVPTMLEEGGVRRKVEVILGHRAEGDGVVRYLVRLEDGEELLLAHDRAANRWQRST